MNIRLNYIGLITVGDGWRIADILRKTKGLPKCYKHFDTRVNVAPEMQSDGVYDEMYPYVTIVGESMAHGLGTGNDDALGKACAEELRQSLVLLIDEWKKRGVETIVCISSVWAFDLHVGILLGEFCKAAYIEFLWTAIEYSLRKKEEHNNEFAAQGASVASCLIDLCDSKKSPIKQMDAFNETLCAELFRNLTI